MYKDSGNVKGSSIRYCNGGLSVADDKSTENQENTILYIRQGDPKDGYAEITVHGGALVATATFYPPATGGSFLTYGLVSQRLEENGIIAGILHDAIQESILAANSSHKPVKEVTIAQSTPPVTGIPEHYLIRQDLLQKPPKIDSEAEKIDWHELSAFTIVHAKDPIAKFIPEVPGEPGKNIYGEEVPYPVQTLPVYTAGKNVISHEKGFFAGKSGRLSIDSKGVISIEDVLLLKKGVDFNTGNIAFPGDVILQGKIADGFRVYSGGSIISSEVLDVTTEVVCKKDMSVQAGIEGKKVGALRIGGNLTAKYIQNCRVAVRGDILVSGSIIQSTVYTMGMIKMGDTGKLVGCECIVIGGVQALDIGSPRGAKTYLRCGTDFIVQQELDRANEQLKHIAVNLMKAEEMIKDEPSDKIRAYIQSLIEKRSEITAKIPTFLPRIDTNDQAYVEVRGSIYPGVEIEICHVPYTVPKIMKQVVFRLDKTRGAIVNEPYKK